MEASKEVFAVGVASGTLKGDGSTRSAIIAEAMRQAVITAQAEGITDPAVIRERIQAARVAAKEALG